MAKVDTDETIVAETPSAPAAVTCDVCGRRYNQRYLTSHKRLSHNGKNHAPSADDTRDVETILALYKRISPKARIELKRRLSATSDQSGGSC